MKKTTIVLILFFSLVSTNIFPINFNLIKVIGLLTKISSEINKYSDKVDEYYMKFNEFYKKNWEQYFTKFSSEEISKLDTTSGE